MESAFISFEELSKKKGNQRSFVRNDIYMGNSAGRTFHYHDFYEISIVFSGTVDIDINYFHRQLQPNSIVILRPGDEHLKFPSDDVNTINIGFTKEVFDIAANYLRFGSNLDLLDEANQPIIIGLNPTDMAYLEQQIMVIKDALWEHSIQAEMSLRILLINLLSKCFPVITDMMVPYPPWFTELLSLLDEPKYFIDGIPSLLKISGKSQEYLCRIFKKYLNLTPSQYINNKRLGYAAYQLSYTNSSIIDVCYDSGFSTLNYFYKCFKDTYGVSPNQYRKSKNIA